MTSLEAPLIDYGDARAECATILRAQLGVSSSAFARSATVGGRVPTGKTAGSVATPYVQVMTLGGTKILDAEEWVSVQVTIWHDEEDEALALASLCRAILHRGSHGQLAACVRLNGIVDTVDLDTQLFLHWFTVRARMRGRVLPL